MTDAGVEDVAGELDPLRFQLLPCRADVVDVRGRLNSYRDVSLKRLNSAGSTQSCGPEQLPKFWKYRRGRPRLNETREDRLW